MDGLAPRPRVFRVLFHRLPPTFGILDKRNDVPAGLSDIAAVLVNDNFPERLRNLNGNPLDTLVPVRANYHRIGAEQVPITHHSAKSVSGVDWPTHA
mgnify:CR=1 FL=1